MALLWWSSSACFSAPKPVAYDWGRSHTACVLSCLQIKLADDEVRLFRAESQAEMEEWVNTVKRASRVSTATSALNPMVGASSDSGKSALSRAASLRNPMGAAGAAMPPRRGSLNSHESEVDAKREWKCLSACPISPINVCCYHACPRS